MLHKNIPIGNIHYIHNWEVDNAAARAALVLTAADRGKLCWQLDTMEFFFLADHAIPTWITALGVIGPQGEPGFTILNGIVAPTTEGVDGDFYINTVLSKIHGPKAAGAWPAGVDIKGIQGDPGLNGSSILNGVVAPTTEGEDGDFYINTATFFIYGPKAAGVWPAGVDLNGTDGTNGINGTNGTNGTNGLGVPAGGATDQILAKVSAADNDTAWIDAPAASNGLPVGGTAGQVLSKIDATNYNAQWVAPPVTGREILTAARTYYVATTGSDSADGLTVGTPFLTIQKAVDVISATLDVGIYQVTIQVADGTYAATIALRRIIGNLASILQGNLTTPANVNITGNIVGLDSGYWKLRDFKVSNAGNYCIRSEGYSYIDFGNLNFGASSSVHLWAERGGRIVAASNYAISGAALAHAYATNGGYIQLANRTLTLTGTPAFSWGFLFADRACGMFEMYSMAFSGSATGKRYMLSKNSVCFTNGAATTYFPGNVAGTTETGGQYI